MILDSILSGLIFGSAIGLVIGIYIITTFKNPLTDELENPFKRQSESKVDNK